MRISIIGQTASGKSTLARKISEKLNIPHLHIDRYWFEYGGGKLKCNDKEGIEKVRALLKVKVEDFIKQESWVSDGWYSKVQPIIAGCADEVIFLDIPLYRRLFNHLKRIIKNDRHKELTKWDDIKYFIEIIRRNFSSKKSKMKQFSSEYASKIKILRNYKDVKKYLDAL